TMLNANMMQAVSRVMMITAGRLASPSTMMHSGMPMYPALPYAAARLDRLASAKRRPLRRSARYDTPNTAAIAMAEAAMKPGWRISSQLMSAMAWKSRAGRAIHTTKVFRLSVADAPRMRRRPATHPARISAKRGSTASRIRDMLGGSDDALKMRQSVTQGMIVTFLG